MRTDDLIRALSRDDVVARNESGRLALRLLPASLAALGLLFLSFFGLRADLSGAVPATLIKLAVTLSLAGSALFLALRLARSTEFSIRPGLLLAIAPTALALAVGVDLARNGPDGWMARMIGVNGLHCLALIPLFSLPPLAAMIGVLRAGAPTRPVFAGLVAGLAASGFGAAFYALTCTEDSPLFIALWYAAATAIVSGFGALLGARLVRW